MLIKNFHSKIYKLNNLFFYFFDIYNFCIIISFKNRYFIIKLPSIFFLKKEKNNYFFLFLKKFYYTTFVRHLFNFYNIFFSLYFFNLKLKGLGFRIFIITKNLIKI